MSVGRDELAADETVVGTELCEVYCQRVDGWLCDLFDTAAEGASGIALVALGGYGRRELCLQSDLDVMLLHDGRSDIGQIADRLWYPVWDDGVKLGYAVRTPKEALTLAGDDLDTATALLPARHLAGDASLTDSLRDRSQQLWERRAKRWLTELSARVAARHAQAGEVAFMLEPDLKEGRGGLRDVHALGWAGAARRILWQGDDDVIDAAHDVLLAVRSELHRRTGRPGDRLVLQEQDAIADALGDADADALMRRVATAARTIAWRSDEAWQRIDSSIIGPLGRIARRDRAIDDGLVLRDGEVQLTADARLGDPTLPLRAAAAAAERSTRINRDTLDRMAAEVPAMPDPWPEPARQALVALLRAGPDALRVIEALDQNGLLVRVLPEWERVQCKPQRNAYHTFTVDRHLCEAAVDASRLVDRVSRPDLLLIGTWLHDIGKGYPGDHTDVGMAVIDELGRRMGFESEDVRVLVSLVQHHLLLADVATRRDLDDPATISSVARAVGAVTTLELLAALTEADSLATGPSAWSEWKAELLATLVDRTRHVLRGGLAAEVTTDFPGPQHADLLEPGPPIIRASDDQLKVSVDDRPGLFTLVAGVCALNGIDVLDAQVATVDGRALEVLRVQSNVGPTIRWDRVLTDLDAALAGRLALQARIAERIRTYQRPTPSAWEVEPRLDFHHDASDEATVIEVRAADAIGVLYRITRAFAELNLDIVKAKVQTLGHEVIDTFYVRGSDGEKLDDPELCRELERAVLHALST